MKKIEAIIRSEKPGETKTANANADSRLEICKSR
jgi:nitrogen regulatory protein PII